MKPMNSITAALTLLALVLTGTAVSAAERLEWTGKDAEGYRYTFHNTAGNRWIGSISGDGKTVSGRYTEVTRTEDFVEVQLDGDKDERTRLYKDKIYSWSKSSGKWIEMGNGKWAY